MINDNNRMINFIDNKTAEPAWCGFGQVSKYDVRVFSEAFSSDLQRAHDNYSLLHSIWFLSIFDVFDRFLQINVLRVSVITQSTLYWFQTVHNKAQLTVSVPKIS